MAIKDTQQKQSKFKAVNILTKEYKYENLILGIVALIAGGFAVMLLTHVLDLASSFPVIGKYPTVFAIVLLVISALSLLLVLVPFFMPAYSEIKKTSWASMKTWWSNNLRVFIFMFIFIVVLLGFDALLKPVMGAIYG